MKNCIYVILAVLFVSFQQGVTYASTQCVDGVDNDEDTFVDELDEGCLGVWDEKAPMITARGGLKAAVLDGEIYAIGGRSSDFPENNLATVEAYNPATDAWRVSVAMAQGRLSPVTEVINGKLYAMAGLNKVQQDGIFEILNSVEVYDPEMGTWVFKAPMPNGRYGASSAVVDDIIYVFGGSDKNSDALDNLEGYNTLMDSWGTYAAIPTPRTASGAVALEDKIYVIGGQSASAESLDVVEVYDPMNNSWSLVKSLPTPVVSPGVAVVNGLLYVYGGHSRGANGTTYVDSVYVYSTSTDSWSGRGKMLTARSQFGSIALSGKLYSIGGGTYDGQAVFHDNLEVFTPSVTEGVVLPSEELDPLILQYVPKLAMHEDEDYLPMDVGVFVEGSSLWDGKGSLEEDVLLKNADELTFAEFESILENVADTGGNTQEYYLAYSDPENSASVDTDAALTKYEANVATNTVYYRKMEDGEYTVLQYWYFYAMNNWKDHKGFNNHEGDWESVFIYLKTDDIEGGPEYIAYSAHHNDGYSQDNFWQYGSVRREWWSDDVQRDGDQVLSYVSFGSHANYPNNGSDGEHKTSSKIDQTSSKGDTLDGADFLHGNELNSTSPFWMEYEGRWGADLLDILDMSSGPKGPKFSAVSGHKRFSNPVEWAGIDLIDKIKLAANQAWVLFEKTGVVMNFISTVPEGVEILVEPYPEWISFGSLPEGVTLLPGFWDISSDLINGAFEVEVSFPYNQEVVAEMGGKANRLSVYFYNELEDAWEQQESIVDELEETVSFRTTHFSRYALGFTQEELTLESLFAQLKQDIKDTDLRSYKKKRLVRYVRLVEVFAQEENVHMHRVASKLLQKLERQITRYENTEKLAEQEAQKLYITIGKITILLQ